MRVIGVEGTSLPFYFYRMSPSPNYQRTVLHQLSFLHFGSINSLRGGIQLASLQIRVFLIHQEGSGPFRRSLNKVCSCCN